MILETKKSLPKVSVIIPIYNVDKYLKASLDCLLSQTMKEMEFILINDGSVDESLKICEEYKKKDARIILINQKNKGVSNARNAGLKVASGEYIGFIDPDDTFTPDMFEKMYSHVKKNNSEICISDYFKVTSIEKIKECSELMNSYISKNDKVILLEQLLGVSDFNKSPIMGTVWRTLIKKDLLDHYNIYFKESISIMEDLVFLVEVIIKSDKITYLNEAHYNYYVRNNSAINSYKKNLGKNNKLVYLSLKNIIDENHYEQELNEALNTRLVYMIIANINNEIKNTDGFIANYKRVKAILHNSSVVKLLKLFPANFTGLKGFYVTLMKYRLTLLVLTISKYK